MALDVANSGVVVRTTLPSRPLPLLSERQAIRTKRLLLRPFRQGDLQGLHVLRTQPEVMTGTSLGRIDSDLEETQKTLDFFLNADAGFMFGIFIPSTGELVGDIGVHTLHHKVAGWGEIGYKLKKEYWGQGFATEFLTGFLEAWWRLPRSEVETKVHPSAVGGEAGMGETVEHVYADTIVDNIASQRVLEKVGFSRFCEWTEPSTQEHLLGEPITVVGFKLARP